LHGLGSDPCFQNVLQNIQLQQGFSLPTAAATESDMHLQQQQDLAS
jgi:hypothetical protein